MRKIFSRLTLAMFALGFIVPSFHLSSKENATTANAATVITTRSSQAYIDNYYSSVDLNQTGSSLMHSLASLLKAERNASFTYSSHQTRAFPYTDADPNDPNGGKILSFYSGKSVKGYSGMNKEHTWPNSHGGGKIDNDPHVIRPTLTSENSARGNMYYAEPPNQGWDPASFSNPKYRGISARIIFYGATIGASSGLTLEDVGKGQGSGNGGKMGKLGDLLKWNLQYPVDATEILRNETLDISLDYNRNPFIDDPSLACKIWGSTNTNTASICGPQEEVDVTSVSVSPSNSNISLLASNKTAQLTANVLPSNATVKTVTWTSSNENVATVSSTGLVTAKAVGSATITARSTDDSTKFGSATINVTNDPILVTGVSVSASTLSIITGGTGTLTANVLPATATNKNVTWTSSNPSVATVTNGVVSALNVGTSTITVTTQDGNFTASSKVTVIEQPVTTTISASFHNTNTANSGGDNGVTVSNLNNGISESSALGFGGTRVVTEVVTSKNGYYPRSAGLAIGSSKNPGTITLRLAQDYHALKVEAKFNGADVADTTVSVTGNGAGAVQKSGSIGTNGSNPSNGTAYTVEFTSPASEITLTASKRTALVELVIHYGQAPVENPSLEQANTWASLFLEETLDGCLTSSLSALEDVWPTVKDAYLDLPSAAQSIITGTIPNGSGTDIEEAVARYTIIVQQYGLEAFIDGIEIQQTPAFTNNDTNRIILPLVLFFTIIGTGGIVVLKLKKKVIN